MTPEFKAQWLEALRSNRYAQGKNNLRSASDYFCCLGVACDLADPNKWQRSPGTRAYTHGYWCAQGFPSSDTLAAIGLDEIAAWRLADMNDEGKSFAEIADYIETHL